MKLKPFKKIIKNQTNCLLSNKQTQTPIKNVTKPNSVRCKNLNGIVAEFYYILMTADRHTVLEMGRESKYIFLYLHILKQLQTLSGLT